MELALYWSVVFNIIFFVVIVYLAFTLLRMDADVAIIRAENQVLQDRAAGLSGILGQTQAVSQHFELMAKANALDSVRVKQLIGLCHPDKHNNSKAATEVTQWLLAQR